MGVATILADYFSFLYNLNRKRLSSSNASPLLGTAVSKFSEARLFCDGNSIQRRPNAGLLLEDIKQEAADISDFDSLDESKLFGSGKKRASLDASDAGFSSGRQAVRSALKSVKLEEDMPHEGETTSTIFASLLDSAIQGWYKQFSLDSKRLMNCSVSILA